MDVGFQDELAAPLLPRVANPMGNPTGQVMLL